MPVTASEPEPLLRYSLAHDRIGVPTLPLYLRTLCAGATLFGVPPFALRLLCRSGAENVFVCGQRWWARSVRRALGLQLSAEGLEHVDTRKTYIITPLHEGFGDVLALFDLPLAMRFAVRDELLTWRLLGPYLRDTRQIAINPEQGARSYRQLLRKASAVLARGESVVIFPQGSILGIETDFMGGAFSLAHKLGQPVLPVALTGSHRIWEHPYTPRLRYNQRMSMRVLPPVSVEELRVAGSEAVRQRVQRALKEAALDGTMTEPRHFVPARDGYWDGYAYEIDPYFAELAADIARHRQHMRSYA